MHTIDIIKKRRSIHKFKDKEIPWDNVVSVLYSALNTPVAGNIFNMKFILVQQPSNKKAIASACYNQHWIAHASVVIAIIGEPEHQKRYYGVRGEKLYTIQNCSAAATTMMIAAESLGLASCWVSAFDEDKLRDILGLPEQVNVHVILPIGFADEIPKDPSKQWIRTVSYLEKWGGSLKVPAYGWYSENVMKTTKGAEDSIKKLARKLLKKKD